MKLYRVTVHNIGVHGPRGLTIHGTGMTTWVFTDKAQANKRYDKELKAAIKNKRKAYLRLQLLVTPDRMTTELWISSIVECEVPYTVKETQRRDKTEAALWLPA